jgi:hypothetical protein
MQICTLIIITAGVQQYMQRAGSISFMQYYLHKCDDKELAERCHDSYRNAAAEVMKLVDKQSTVSKREVNLIPHQLAVQCLFEAGLCALAYDNSMQQAIRAFEAAKSIIKSFDVLIRDSLNDGIVLISHVCAR